jgi:hypothetical protein
MKETAAVPQEVLEGERPKGLNTDSAPKKKVSKKKASKKKFTKKS